MGRRNKKTEESEYEVQEIISHRTIKGRREYKIRWKGYTESDDSWEVEDNLNCHSLIEEYQANLDNTDSGSKKPASKPPGRGKRQNGEGGTGESPADELPVNPPKRGRPTNQKQSPAKETPSKPSKTPRKKAESAASSTPGRRSVRQPVPKKTANDDQPEEKTLKKSKDSKKKQEKAKGKEYEVEKIEKMKIGRNGKRMFLVHWVGFKESDATWEPEEHLKGTNLLDKFLKTQA